MRSPKRLVIDIARTRHLLLRCCGSVGTALVFFYAIVRQTRRAVRQVTIEGGNGGIRRRQLCRIWDKPRAHARIVNIFVCGFQDLFIVVRADEVVQINR
jgi:hypothetical protein